jgi:DNA invertase Pin-like site-specific DNA recombinase
MKTAISYLRFSSRQQARTDSYRRQIEATENLSDESALGGFLKLVEAGKIPKQTVLIVENLDRLSRAKILDAMHVFTGIIKCGVDIVTTMDGKWYSEQSITENPTDLMISIIYLTRGNNESETKSVRVRQSWVNKHENIKQGKFSKFHCPSWLNHDGIKYSLIEQNAAAIRTIFDLYLKGYGVYSLIQELNKRKVKPFTKTKAWNPVFVHEVLQNPAIIGTNINVNPPRANYYPPVVSEEIFYKAINQRKQNTNFRGKSGIKEINIFGGLCKCFSCGSNLVKYSCKGKGKNGKHYTFLICSQAKVGKCKYSFTPFQKFSDSFLRILNMANFTGLLFAKEPETPNNSETIRGKITNLQKTIERVTDAIVKTDSPALVSRLVQLELDRKQLEKDYETTKAEALGKTDVKQEYADLMKELSANLNDNTFRLRLRNLMRRHITKIEVEAEYYTVFFKYGPVEMTETIRVTLNKNDFELRYWDEVEVYDYSSLAKAA